MNLHSRDSWLHRVNMTNCCNHRRCFFEKYGSIDESLLIAYWMMAGYLDPVESVEEGYEKGFNILMALKRKGMVSKTSNMVSSASADSDLNNHCSHEGHCTVTNLGFDDLLDLRQLAKPTFTDGVIKDEKGSLLLLDGSQVLESTLSPLKSFKHMACFRARTKSVKALLENVDEPSLLLLRDCWEIYLDIVASFEKLKSLTVLENPGTYYPGVNIPELTKLQFLNLSGMEIEKLPEDFFSKLKQLRWLILRSCPRLKTLPSLNSLINLEVLDLSSSSKLHRLAFGTVSCPKLRILECSGTAVKSIPQLETTHLTHLLMSNQSMSFRALRAFSPIKHPRSIQLLDLSHAGGLQQVDLSQLDALQVLDLSFTGISSIDSVEDKVHLRKLVLTRCRGLEKLPALDNLVKLEVLDLSETGINRLPSFANQSRLQKLSLRQLQLVSLGTLSSLSGLVELDLSKVKIRSSGGFNVDFLESLLNLQTLNLSHTSVVDLPALTNHARLKELFLAGCPHLNTLPDVNTLGNLNKLVLNDVSNKPQKHNRQFMFLDLADIVRDLESAVGAVNSTNGNNNTHTWQLKKVIMDLNCIIKHKGRFENSPNFNKACELIQHLQNVYRCSTESPKLEILVQTVAKLKLLLPRTQTDDSQSSAYVEKKEPKFKRVNVVDDTIKKLTIPETTQQMKIESLIRSYESLTSNEKHCLLCFSIFPVHVLEGNHKEVLLRIEIKKQMLIYWWAGEGFINIHSEQATSDNKGKTEKTIEDTGEDILRALADKGFIQPVIKKSRETRRCSMNIFVHSFVTQQAKLENFFNFSNKNGKLTPMLKGSHRACLLRSQDHIPSSCHFWAVNAKSPDKLKRFKMVKTLFNVDESVIHIQPEWFSEMRDLCVLHLGNWHSEDPEHIEIRDKTFMEGMKRMKQLKFFSLQGVSTIAKLPDSVCKLTNLIILDLKDCHQLEDLPANIGSLKNLTHLDISNCHLLDRLPKGVMLLSKLEVLKGFVIYEQLGDLQEIKDNILGGSNKGHWIRDLLHRKNNEVCTFRDLLKLQNLRKLSIVVNNENFPDGNELEAFKQMENLHKLKISWGKNLKDNKKSHNIGQQGEDNRPSQDQGKNKHVEKKPRRETLDQIEKLELWGFPNKTAPDWLVPDQLENLKKLYIRGGKLEKLPEISSSKEWNVTTLRLRYLPGLMITWDALRAMFPKMTYLDKCECKKLRLFPCDDEGVWIINYE